MFGKVREVPQTEMTPFHPRSPYGISKVAGFDLTRNYREAYGMFCLSGILFNHEGPRRGFEFVTRKITSTARRSNWVASRGDPQPEAKRDWGTPKITRSDVPDLQDEPEIRDRHRQTHRCANLRTRVGEVGLESRARHQTRRCTSGGS